MYFRKMLVARRSKLYFCRISVKMSPFRHFVTIVWLSNNSLGVIQAATGSTLNLSSYHNSSTGKNSDTFDNAGAAGAHKHYSNIPPSRYLLQLQRLAWCCVGLSWLMRMEMSSCTALTLRNRIAKYQLILLTQVINTVPIQYVHIFNYF